MQLVSLAIAYTGTKTDFRKLLLIEPIRERLLIGWLVLSSHTIKGRVRESHQPEST